MLLEKKEMRLEETQCSVGNHSEALEVSLRTVSSFNVRSLETVHQRTARSNKRQVRRMRHQPHAKMPIGISSVRSIQNVLRLQERNCVWNVARGQFSSQNASQQQRSLSICTILPSRGRLNQPYRSLGFRVIRLEYSSLKTANKQKKRTNAVT